MMLLICDKYGIYIIFNKHSYMLTETETAVNNTENMIARQIAQISSFHNLKKTG